MTSGEFGGDGDLILSQSPPQSEPAATISLAGRPPSDVWTELATSLLPALVDGINQTVSKKSISPARAVAQAIATDEHPTDHERILGSIIASCRSGVPSEQQWSAAKFMTSLGSGDVLDGGIRTDIQDACSVAQLVETDQPVIVRFGEDFKQQRADQRRDICNLISHLSTAAEVYLVPKTLRLERWIAYEHDVDLPGSLIEQCNTGRTEPSVKSETVQNAIERFDIDGGIIELLRSVAATPAETRTLDDLESELGVQRDTIHNRLHHLREYELVSETLSTEDGSAVSLTSTGRAYLDAVYEYSGVQATIEESLIAGGKSADNMPCNPACPREGGGGWNRNRLPHLHETRELSRHRYHATLASTADTDISVVDTDTTPLEDRAAPGIYYNHDDRTLLVSAEYDNPMSWWVCIARALSSEQIWSWILTDDKLDDADCAKFREFFTDHKVALRQLRCLGYLPDRITEIDEFRDLILDAKDDLLELTKRLTNEDYPEGQNRSEFRSTILSDAQGLAGTMSHVLDLVDVEILREVRLPRYREFSPEKKQGLIKTIGVGASIQSVYGEATGYRQLYEHRNDKRAQAIEPDVDAHDPYAELIGSFAIVGDFKTQKADFVDGLTSEIQPCPPHQDAPEFQINIAVKDRLSRSEYALTVTKLCKEKNLKPTPEAISTLAGICNSPYEVAEALNYLQPNDDRRSIDAREVRYGLAQLDADDILRGTSSTPRKTIIALLNATKPLSQSELADRADVSERSLRDHLPELLDLGLIDETPTGYRFNLSFNTGDERTDDRYPMYVVDPELRPDIHKAAKALKTAHEHHFGTPIPDDEFPTGVTGSNWCVDLRGLPDPDPWIRDVLPLLWGLESRDEYRNDADLGPLLGSGEYNEIRIGPDIPQSRLAAYSASQAAG